jgi:hypothetical protein
MSYQPNIAITDVFYHGTTGKVDGDFTKRLYLNGILNGVTVVITEISNGYYKVAFIPNAEGSWALALEESNLKWEETYNVIALALEANIETHATASLNSYDPPTKTELDAGLAALNDITAIEVRTEMDTNSTIAANTIKTRKTVCNKIVIDDDANTYIIYDDNGTTPLYTGSVTDLTRVPA